MKKPPVPVDLHILASLVGTKAQHNNNKIIHTKWRCGSSSNYKKKILKFKNALREVEAFTSSGFVCNYLFRNKPDEVWRRAVTPFHRFSETPGKNRQILRTEACLFSSELQLTNLKPNMS